MQFFPLPRNGNPANHYVGEPGLLADSEVLSREMNMKTKVLSSIAVVLFFCSGQVLADSQNQPGGVDLGEVLVSATKTEIYQGEVGSSSTVITAEEIKKGGKQTVLEVLRSVPGVTVSSTGSLGGGTAVYLRGAKPGHTLVMIDGVEVNDPMSTDRSFDFAHLSTDNIERIEVVRGPQSTLYGSDAMAGVINIITKKGSGDPKFTILSEGGSHNTFKENTGLSGSKEKWDYSFFSSRLDSDGISKAAGGAEKDGYENITLSSRVGYKVMDEAELSLVTRYTDAKTDLDDDANQDDPNNTAWWKNTMGKVAFDQAVNPVWDHKLSFSYAETTRKYKDEADSVDTTDNTHNWYNSDDKKFEWQHNLKPVDWSTTTAGFEYANERGFGDGRSSGNRFDRKTVDNKGYYLQNQFKFWEKLFITPGLRVDDHEMFGTETTYKVSTAYWIDQTKTRLKGNWGTAFKAPSLYQLYSSYGSPTLLPDKSKNYDFGFEQKVLNDKVSFDATYFNNDYKNMVDWDSVAYKYKNIGKAETKGVELGAKYLPVEWLTFASNFTYTETEDKETGLQLLRRPMRQVNFDIDWKPVEKMHLDFGITHVGSRKDVVYDAFWNPVTVTNKAYSTVRLASSYDLTKDIQIFGRIENLFDKKYQEVVGYETLGRSAYGGVKMRF